MDDGKQSALKLRTLRCAAGMALIVCAIVLLSVVLDRVAAYNDDGHFYTTVSIAHSHLPAFKDKMRDAAVLMGLCAQLPDLAKEYDAVSLRVHLIASFQGSLWGGFSSCWGGDVCHMVTVHHYLHGFTDGDAEAVTAAAVATLGALLPKGESAADLEPNRVCAAGFAIHLLGDSFSHRQIRSPKRMYPPGLGHFRDDHNPDFILYDEERIQNYVKYARALDGALKSTPDDARWAALGELLKRSRAGAALGNRYNEIPLRDGFRGTLKLTAGDHTQIWAPYKPTVEELTNASGIVLTRTCKDVLDTYKPALTLAGVQELNCNKVWKAYKDVAIPAFAQQKIPKTCPPDDKWSDGVSK